MKTWQETQIEYFNKLEEFKTHVPYGDKRPRTSAAIRKIIMDNLTLSPKSVIEFGCGNGSSTSLFPSKWQHWGIDMCPKAIKVAKKAGIKTIIGDVEYPPKSKIRKWGKFDIAFSSEVIEHVLRPKAMLRNMLESVHARGMVIITTPNINSVSNRWRMLKGELPPFYNLPGHIQPFNEKRIVQIMKDVKKESGYDGNIHYKFVKLTGLPRRWQERILVYMRKC
jgi:2-polyprenyl-3-methyl-5-hydroxy-6-metoxy-1,4-benzoquinol methylase